MALYEILSGWSNWVWPLLANHLWQATLFSLLAYAASMMLRRAPAGARYYVWITALIKFALPSALLIFVVSGVGIDLPTITQTVVSPAPSVMAMTPLLSPVETPSDFQHAAETVVETDATTGAPVITPAVAPRGDGLFYNLLTFVWLSGCCLLLVSWWRRRRRLSAALRAGRRLESGREVETLRRVQSWLGERRRIGLVVTRAVSEPGVWRVWRPLIVLPEGVADEMDDGELETVLLHEVTHVERWDNLAGNVQRFLCCLFWFHPLVWLIDKRLLAEREQACDDAVVRISGASEAYASSIAKVCRHYVGTHVAGVSGAAGSGLKQRIERILSDRAGGRPTLAQLAIVALTAVAALTLSIAAGQSPDGKIADLRKLSANAGPSATPDARFEWGTTAQMPEPAGVSVRERAVAAWQQAHAGAAPSVVAQSGLSPAPPLEVYAEGETLDTSPPSSDLAAILPRAKYPPPEPPADIDVAVSTQAAIVKAADVEYGDLRRFIGRYEVDPNRAENYVLDISLEYGELWLKPSHTEKRRLIRLSENAFSDSSGKFKFTCVLDDGERVVGLRLEGWGRNVTARKLALPGPSLKGNTTFRLKGHAGARVVAVAGTFNQWNQSQLLFAREGNEWVCRVNLPPGTYQYKFIVDGNWLTDPINPKTVEDDRGFVNSLLTAE